MADNRARQKEIDEHHQSDHTNERTRLIHDSNCFSVILSHGSQHYIIIWQIINQIWHFGYQFKADDSAIPMVQLSLEKIKMVQLYVLIELIYQIK